MSSNQTFEWFDNTQVRISDPRSFVRVTGIKAVEQLPTNKLDEALKAMSKATQSAVDAMMGLGRAAQGITSSSNIASAPESFTLEKMKEMIGAHGVKFPQDHTSDAIRYGTYHGPGTMPVLRHDSEYVVPKKFAGVNVTGVWLDEFDAPYTGISPEEIEDPLLDHPLYGIM